MSQSPTRWWVKIDEIGTMSDCSACFFRPKSLRKLRDSIKPRTKRTSGRSMEAMIAELNPKLKGWFGYFKHA
ncbi:MAG: group II intron maturase-specific domain-containing protein [Verrucomicrobiota bacterium]